MRLMCLRLFVAVILLGVGASNAPAQDVTIGLDVNDEGKHCLGDGSFYYFISNHAPWEGLVFCFPQLKSDDGSWSDLIETDEDGRAQPSLYAGLVTTKTVTSIPITDEWLAHFDAEGQVRVRCAFVDVDLGPDAFDETTTERANTARRIVMTTRLVDLLRSAALRTSKSITVATCTD